MAKKLTVAEVSRLRKKTGLHSDGQNLYLQVSKAGVASWIFRYQSASGVERAMGLGLLHTVGLAKAREKAAEYRALRIDGVDPLEHREAKRRRALLDAAKSMTFSECARAYIAARARLA
jgi:hypothetical protein